MAWCQTTAELVVLAQRGRLRAVVVDGRARGIDGDLLDLVQRHCPVLVADGRTLRPRWEALGASVLPSMPAEPDSLARAVAAAETRIGVHGHQPGHGGAMAPLVAVVAGAGVDGATVASSLALRLAIGPAPAPVVLADLTLDAPLRAFHGIADVGGGLPDVVAAARFGDPPAAAVDAALHPVGPVLVLPGLRRHHDWVSLGTRSVRAAIGAVRSRAGLVVAHVDPDLEGEAETGSFDIEDRNVLARTAAATADLVVLIGGARPPARSTLMRQHDRFTAFGVPAERILVAGTRGRRLAAAVERRLATGAGGAPSAIPEEPVPERIVPGMLGHWAHDIDGWITPRVPQQP